MKVFVNPSKCNSFCRACRKPKKGGFTLIELLVVIAILSILAVTVFVALNPVKRLADSRNSRRSTDIANILTAIHECIVDSGGAISTCVGSLTADEKYEIVSDATSGCDDVCNNATSDIHCADLDTLLADYLKELPKDPGGVTIGHTEYEISVDANNMVTITSCSAESPESYGTTDTLRISR